MTVTEYGYCHNCDDRVELVMTEIGLFACCRCESLDVGDDPRKHGQ